MSYQKDGSPYKIRKSTARPDIVHYGWISSFAPFQKAAYPQDFTFLERLAKKVDTRLTRGHHTCELCNWENPIYGNGELWIKVDKTVYVLPRMVWHYVKEHLYKLPDEFQAELATGRFLVLTDDEIDRMLQDTTAKTISVPFLICRIMWKESRYGNLALCVSANSCLWGVSHATAKDGYYIATIDFLPDNIDILFENDPDNFPDRIEILRE